MLVKNSHCPNSKNGIPVFWVALFAFVALPVVLISCGKQEEVAQPVQPPAVIELPEDEVILPPLQAAEEGGSLEGGQTDSASLTPPLDGDAYFAERRVAMVRNQIERHWDENANRNVRDPAVLAAMRAVPRHRFVPEEYAHDAYGDHPLPIGYGQTISQPYIVAAMTEAAGVKPDSRALEIGTGSGYQAAVLGEIAAEVFTIEIVPELGERAAELLENLGYENVEVRVGDGYKGWPEEAPFDVIIVTAAPEEVPRPLLDQLAPGGRLIIPVGPQRGTQFLKRIHRTPDGKLTEENLMGVRFVPFIRSEE